MKINISMWEPPHSLNVVWEKKQGNENKMKKKKKMKNNKWKEKGKQ